MGVKNLNKLIQQYAPRAHHPFRMSLLHGAIVGIDAFCWLYELKFRIKNNNKSFEINFYEKLYSITSQKPEGIYFVFDGKAPPEKNETLQKRREEKNKLTPDQRIRLTKEDMIQYRTVIRQTPHAAIVNGLDEAEATLAKLEKEKKIDYIFSSDTDILPLGASYIFRNKNNVWIRADVAVLRKALGVTQSQLVDICVMLGNDFNHGLKKVGPTMALELIRKYGSMESILKDDLKYKDLSTSSEERMMRTRVLFTDVLGEYKNYSSLRPNKEQN